jgi:hypothetical protein
MINIAEHIRQENENKYNIDDMLVVVFRKFLAKKLFL